MSIEIRKVEKEEMRENLFGQYLDLVHTRMLEYFPNEKPLTEADVKRWLDDEEDETVISLNAFCNGQIVGQMDVITRSESNPEYEINKGFGKIYGYVRKKFRGKGIGTLLAKKSLHAAKEIGLHTISISTYLESGDRFIQHLGGTQTCKFSGMKLELENVDWNLIDQWLEISSKNNTGWTIENHTKVNEQFISDVLDLSFAIHNDLININSNDTKILKEVEEKGWRDSGKYSEKYMKHYYCFLVKDGNGKTIGYTEAGIGHDNNSKLSQYVTGVATDHRGKGIGKYLKALMLDLVREKHPEVTYITTGNNDMNSPMLGINTKLGFVKTDSETGYKLSVDEGIKRISKNESNNQTN